jgi:hypothetical protein
MVTHVVLFTPRPDLSHGDRQNFAQAFQQAVRAIPTVREVKVGRRVKHGAGYERATDDAADFIAIIEFERIEDLQAYLNHPAHDAVARHFHESLSSALAYDFEMTGLDDLDRLV